MELQVTKLAAAKLHLLLWAETVQNPLAIHVLLLTSGCNTPSFGLEVIEPNENMRKKTISSIPFIWYQEEETWLNGIILDINRENGKFIIEHPNYSLLTNCPMEQEVDRHLDI